jgi:hypothetical protein
MSAPLHEDEGGAYLATHAAAGWHLSPSFEMLAGRHSRKRLASE